MPDDEALDADASAGSVSSRATGRAAEARVDANDRATDWETLEPPKKKRRFEAAPAEYVVILNQMIADARSPFQPVEDGDVPAGRIGASMWSSEEKSRALSSLQRFSLTQVDDIAAVTKTKSSVEVQAYMEALQAGRDHLATTSGALDKNDWNMSKIPAAVEVAGEVERKLDMLSDKLVAILKTEDDEVSEAMYGSWWRLDHNVANWVNDQLNEECIGSVELEERLPSGVLLNLDRWLDLSANVFMNAAEPYEHLNYTQYAEEKEKPSIHLTAFQDFHTIALGVTKKLLRTAMYIAESRYRISPPDRKTPLLLAPAHVTAAAEFLRLPSNKFEFWKTAAQRNHVRVFDKRTFTKPEDVLDYKEVERILAQPKRKILRPAEGQDVPQDVLPVEDEHPDATESDSSEEEAVAGPSEKKLDSKLEELDRRLGMKELNRLRKVVGLPLVDESENDLATTDTLRIRRRFTVQPSWALHCEYLPEWETRLDNEAARQYSAELEDAAASAPVANGLVDKKHSLDSEHRPLTTAESSDSADRVRGFPSPVPSSDASSASLSNRRVSASHMEDSSDEGQSSDGRTRSSGRESEASSGAGSAHRPEDLANDADADDESSYASSSSSYSDSNSVSDSE